MTTENPGTSREAAIASLRRKSEFRKHLLTYLVVNIGLVVIWFFTSRGFFWPLFPILGWGIGLAFHAYDVYTRGPSEERIRREIQRQSRS